MLTRKWTIAFRYVIAIQPLEHTQIALPLYTVYMVSWNETHKTDTVPREMLPAHQNTALATPTTPF